MLALFSPIFMEDTKIIFGYDFEAPLKITFGRKWRFAKG